MMRWIDLFPSGSRRNRVPLLLGAAYLASLRSDFAGTEEILEEIEAISGESPLFECAGHDDREARPPHESTVLAHAQAHFLIGDADLLRSAEAGNEPAEG